MQFNTRTRKLALTKREHQILLDSRGILEDAARMIGDEVIREAAQMVDLAGRILVRGPESILASPSGDTSDPPSQAVKK